MSSQQLPKAYNQYGSSMGRRAYHADGNEKYLPFRFRLNRVHLDSGGYDNGGAYWGTGQPLYHAEADEIEWLEKGQELWAEGPDFFFRAYDRADAKDEVAHRYPNARFFQ